VAKVLAHSRELVAGTRAIQRTNHENDRFDCPGCAWPDDTKGLHLDICAVGIEFTGGVASLICALPGDWHTVADALAEQEFSVVAAAGAARTATVAAVAPNSAAKYVSFVCVMDSCHEA
jgi:hypothetical protein